LGSPNGSGEFFDRVGDLAGDLDAVNGWTAALGAASIAALVALRRLAPAVPGTLVVLVAVILVAAAFGLDDHGVDLVGDLPLALPDPAVPDVALDDLVNLLPAAVGVMVLSTEAVGVARAIASKDGYAIDPSRELIAIGGSNALAGLSSGFVRSSGASQTMAAENAGGKTPATALIAAVLIVLTGAFLAPVFEDLPQATLAAIVVVAVASFVDYRELARLARLRRSAILLALLAFAGVLLLGVLPGLLIAAGISLVLVIQRISRPTVAVLARDPVSGRWGNAERAAHRSSCSSSRRPATSTSAPPTRSRSSPPSSSAKASSCGWPPCAPARAPCCGGQALPTGSGSSSRSTPPPANRRACQP
jgi:SulP family sulfate permease